MAESFQDFTTATNWERFAANIESHLLQWVTSIPPATQGPIHVVDIPLEQTLTADSYPYKLQCISPAAPAMHTNPTVAYANAPPVKDVLQHHGMHAPSMASHGPSSSSQTLHPPNVLPWWCCPPSARLVDAHHKLQQWFGVTHMAIVVPLNYTQRVMRPQESTLVLSAAAVALHALLKHCPSVPVVVFVPVQSNIQDAYHGVALTPTGQYIRLDTTALRTASPPPPLVHTHGLVATLAAQVGGYSHNAAGALHQLLHDMDIATQAGALVGGVLGGGGVGGLGDDGWHAGEGGGGELGGDGGGDDTTTATSGDTTAGYSGGAAAAGDSNKNAAAGKSNRNAAGAMVLGYGHEPAWVVSMAVQRCFVVPRVLVGGDVEWDEGAPWRGWFVQRDTIGDLVVDVQWDMLPPNSSGDDDALDVLQASCWRLTVLHEEADTHSRGLFPSLKSKPGIRAVLRIQPPQSAPHIHTATTSTPAEDTMQNNTQNTMQNTGHTHNASHVNDDDADRDEDGGGGGGGGSTSSGVYASYSSGGDAGTRYSSGGDAGTRYSSGICGAATECVRGMIAGIQHAHSASSLGQLASAAWWVNKGLDVCEGGGGGGDNGDGNGGVHDYSGMLCLECGNTGVYTGMMGSPPTHTQKPSTPHKDATIHFPGEQQQGVPPPAPGPATLQDTLHTLLDRHVKMTITIEARTAHTRGTHDATQGCGVFAYTAPVNSLLARVAMQALLFQNPRAIATMWLSLVDVLRVGYWETGRPLPHMCRVADPQTPTWGTCVLHQKLQMMDYCIMHMGPPSLSTTPAKTSHSHHHHHTPAHSTYTDAHTPADTPARHTPPSSSSDTSDEEEEDFASAQGGDEEEEGEGEGEGEGDDHVYVDEEDVLHSHQGGRTVSTQRSLRFESVHGGGGGSGGSGGGATTTSKTTTAPPTTTPPPATTTTRSPTTQGTACTTQGTACTAQRSTSGLAVPVGVLRPMPGVFLRNHPHRPLHVPITHAQAITEDELHGRATILAADFAVQHTNTMPTNINTTTNTMPTDNQPNESTTNTTYMPTDNRPIDNTINNNNDDPQAHTHHAQYTHHAQCIQQSLTCQLVLEDMRAFLLANPGAVLNDFQRWKQPEAYDEYMQVAAQSLHTQLLLHARPLLPTLPIQQQSSNAHETPPPPDWSVLWRKACDDVAAAQQQDEEEEEEQELQEQQQQGQVQKQQQHPLTQEQQQWKLHEAAGERALHWLETVPPGALLQQLLGVALDCLVCMWRACEGAGLPTAAAVLDRFEQRFGPTITALGRSGMPSPHPIPSSATHQPTYPCVPLDELDGLVQHLQYTEAVITTAESLIRRLLGNVALAQRALSACVGEALCAPVGGLGGGMADDIHEERDGGVPFPTPSPHATPHHHIPRPPTSIPNIAASGTIMLTGPFDRRWMDAVMNLQVPLDESASTWDVQGAWRSVHSTCWVLQCAPGRGMGACHRLMVWWGEGELRIATMLASDDGGQ